MNYGQPKYQRTERFRSLHTGFLNFQQKVGQRVTEFALLLMFAEFWNTKKYLLDSQREANTPPGFLAGK